MAHQPIHAGLRTTKTLISPTQLTPGAEVKLSLAALADQFAGEPAYLVGIRLTGPLQLTAAAGVNGQSNYAYQLQRAIRNVRLVVAGHQHTSNIDGEDLIIDEALRTGQSRLAAHTFAELVTGTQTRTVDVCIRLDNPRAITERRHDQAVAVGLFNNDQDSYLEFQVGTSLETGTDLAVAAAGFAAGLQVTYYVVHRNDIVQHTPWVLRTITETQLEQRIVPRGALQYLINANRTQAALGRVDHSATDWQSFRIGGEMLHGALTSDDYIQRAIFDRPNAGVDAPLSAIGWKDDNSTATHGWSGTPLYLPPADTRATKLHRGELTIQLGSMPGAFTDNRVRYLLRETGSDNAEHAIAVASRLGISRAELEGGAPVFFPKATNGGGTRAASILPKRVRAFGTRFAGPGRRWAGRRK